MAKIKSATTKWKRISNTRLRRCLNCDAFFPSTSRGERCCPKCSRSLDDARTRAGSTPAETHVRQLIDTHFDADLVERRQREAEWDEEARERRRKLRR